MKLKFNVLLIGWVLFLNPMLLSAQREMPVTEPLSSSAYITLLTCDPGEELYATFGHSAIGVVDAEQGIDWVFNYGTFNFEVPHFYAKFASGKLLYQLSFSSRKYFLREYEHRQRKVYEDVLNLTTEQEQRLFDYLKENYKPENRSYQYDFFFDNCATRILDILYLSLGDSLVYTPEAEAQVPTFRQMIDQYLVKSHWSDFGIDLALGSVIDKPATPRQQAFIPDYLRSYLAHSSINGLPMILKSELLVAETAPIPVTPFLLHPVFLFWLLFVFIAVASFVWQKKSWAIADRLFFATWGLTGLVVFLLWVATDHDATAGNLNILWANPLYIIYVFVVSNPQNFIRIWFLRLFIVLNTFVLLGWMVIPQDFNPVFIPIIGALLIRLGVHTFHGINLSRK